MAPSRFPHLLDSFEIKGVQLRNRMVKSGQWTLYAEADGSVGDRLIAYYEDLAVGGVGMITVEESLCEYPLGASDMPHIRLDEDRLIPGLRRLTDAVHAAGCPIGVQVTHAGPAHSPDLDGERPVAPSESEERLEVENIRAAPRALTQPEILRIIESYAQAARRAWEAGFDAVEMHMAHYALGNAFLTRIQNRRTDDYGCQSLETRSRFGVKILERVRALVPDGFIVGVRMNGREWGHGLATTAEEAQDFARRFEAAGADYLQVSGYGYGPWALAAIPDLTRYPEPGPGAEDFAARVPDGALLDVAAAIKQVVSIPVSGVGHLTPETGDRAIAEGKVDLVCLGRPLLADPHLPIKLHDDREDEVRPCLRCNLCLDHILRVQPLRCRINPYLGEELTMPITPVEVPRDVMVVGAGPAGLEAARVAAERGHKVTVYERSRVFGGLMPLAVFVKGTDTDDLQKCIDYFRTQLGRLGVGLRLGTEVDADLVRKAAPDVVVVAVGGEAIESTIPGRGVRVITTDLLRRRLARVLRVIPATLARRLTRIYLPVGKRVVVVGADLAGLETAEFLVKRGRSVTVIEASAEIGHGLPVPWKVRLLPWLAARRVEIHTQTKPVRVERHTFVASGPDGVEVRIPADSAIVVTHYGRNTDLADRLREMVAEVHLVGDADAGEGSEYVLGAIHSGGRVGVAL